MNKTLSRIVFSSALLLAGALWHQPILLYVALLLVGYDILWEAVQDITHVQIGENVLMSLAAIGACILGETLEGVLVLLLYQLGEMLQGMAVQRSRASVAEMMQLRPDQATVYRDGVWLDMDPSEIAVGERIRIKVGDRVPLDAMVTLGESALDMASLTGEAVPRAIAKGDSILSGSINLDSQIEATVLKVDAESTASRILSLVEDAQTRRSPRERFITRFARIYTPVVILLALLVFVVPPLFFSGAWHDWGYRALSFLVVSCPCALVLSVPLTFFCGIGGAARRGILFKGTDALERLSEVQTIAFDKTGTLTTGRFAISHVEAIDGDPQRLLRLAASAQVGTTHPIGLSLRMAAKDDLLAVTSVESLRGLGQRAMLDGKVLLVGNQRLLAQNGMVLAYPAPAASVFVALDGIFMGSIHLSDEFKPHTKDAIAALRTMGIRHMVLVTGDTRTAGEQATRALGLDECFAECLPEDKMTVVTGLGAHTAFVGDGLNDAPVLTHADMGIAMGGLGSDASIEAADCVLMTDDPALLPLALRQARRTLSIVKQNIVFALSFKGIVLVLSALGFTPLWLAIVADVGVTLLCTLYAFRTYRLPRGTNGRIMDAD